MLSATYTSNLLAACVVAGLAVSATPASAAPMPIASKEIVASSSPLQQVHYYRHYYRHPHYYHHRHYWRHHHYRHYGWRHHYYRHYGWRHHYYYGYYNPGAAVAGAAVGLMTAPLWALGGWGYSPYYYGW
jgi:hypothetical protein